MKEYIAFNQDCLELMPTLESESIDIICIDPPYKYLKNQKLESDFNELEFFTEAKRLLTKDGFIIMFGRGTSFYRMNTILDSLGFNFKEEIVWDKAHTSSPLMSLSRVHETVSIFTNGNGKINKIKVPYLEVKGNYLDAICVDIKRMRSILKNTKSLNSLLKFLDDKMLVNEDLAFRSTTVTSEKIGKPDRTVSVMNSIQNGMNEKSIIKNVRDHYSSIHPTQKPVRLLERLLLLCLPDKPRNEILIADFFGGSFSTAEAIHNLGCNILISEIDKEYFDLGNKRIENILKTNANTLF